VVYTKQEYRVRYAKRRAQRTDSKIRTTKGGGKFVRKGVMRGVTANQD
jgi:hypothetical protein